MASHASANGRTFRERLLSRLIIDESGCLLWTGARSSDGYGHISNHGSMVAVHRVMYETFAGPIPEGLQLDHLCRVRTCANVAHLEPVTCRENVLRGLVPLRAAGQPRRTHCSHNHAFDQANVYQDPRGKRRCRKCRKAQQIRRRATPLEVTP